MSASPMHRRIVRWSMVLLLILVLVAVGYGLGTRIANFSDNWPKYGSVLRGAADAVEGKINGIEGRVAPVGGAAGAPDGVPVSSGLLHNLVLRGMGRR